MSSTTPSLPLNFYRPKPEPRPVDPHWKCHQSGDCCENVAEVVMTREERSTLLPKVPQGIKTAWRDLDPEGKMVALRAHPCPFFIFHECLVYEVRPYNCRRFACLRPNPKTEPLELVDNDEARNPTGCENADARFITSRVARRVLVRIQRKAQVWARQHGWGD
jgi:Fe-S-cluster containining protein